MKKNELALRIGGNVRRYREALKLSMGGVADRCTVSEDYLGHIERGDKVPSVEVLSSLATALDVRVDDLLKQRGAVKPDTVGRRLQTILHGMSSKQRKDVLAILIKLRRAERIAALKTALGA